MTCELTFLIYQMPLAEQFLDLKTKLLSSGFFTSSFLQLSLYLMVTLSHINGFLSLENTVILPVACGRSVVQTAQPSLDGFAELLAAANRKASQLWEGKCVETKSRNLR